MKTFPTVEKSAEGFVYRYYSEIEMTSGVGDTHTALQYLRLDVLTYAECRRRSDPQWHTVKIADTIYGGNGVTTKEFSVTPLYKAILMKLLK